MERTGKRQRNKEKSPLLEGLLIAGLLTLFGFLTWKAHYAALLLLALCAWRMAHNIGNLQEGLYSLGIRKPGKWWYLWLAAGLGTGAFAWAFFRILPEDGIIFPRIGLFAISAFLVGLAEELVYRGFLFHLWQRYGAVVVIALTSLAHLTYKLALLLPQPSVDLELVASWTVIAGLVLGMLRYFSGSVLPAAANHILFDVLAYGSSDAGPDWVW